ncbi:MAG: UDP-N-acetylmuramoyl-L-alanine--D-glutamate ligase [Sulfurovum sp.]|nr:UDP-N-acetylmuramoyl-L-alanine--D-glutamate ligase [Sulfurovum sp.]
MKPTLFGYGLTTKAIAHALGGGCTFFDDNVKEPYTDEEGNRLFPSYLFDPQASSLEVTTPSLKPSHPLIQKAKHLLSEYDYFLGNEQLAASSEQPKTEVSQSDTYRNSSLLTPRSSLSKPFTIWISGTNGKTTTTQMLTHLLKNRGAVSGGNIGTPLAALSPDAPIWVLETSSFTLHHTHSASPDIYLLLPITPDHLDWHGTPQQYEADKLKPLLTMKEGELALVPKGLHLPQTKAYVVEYDSNAFLAEYFKIDSTKIRFKAAFLQDALLALAVTKVLFDEIDYECINAFVLDAHRQEEFKDVRGRLWVNDSKATNLDATIQALKGYADKPIHLILGGDDKGVDLSPLFESMRELDVTLYIIGANQEKLLALAKTYGIKAVNTQTIDKAVEAIDKVHTSKSTALLSPAAASLDQFTSYKHRGETFMQLVKALS